MNSKKNTENMQMHVGEGHKFTLNSLTETLNLIAFVRKFIETKTIEEISRTLDLRDALEKGRNRKGELEPSEENLKELTSLVKDTEEGIKLLDIIDSFEQALIRIGELTDLWKGAILSKEEVELVRTTVSKGFTH